MPDRETNLSFLESLSSIERFHYLDGNCQFPNLIYCRLQFNQPINPDFARQAWRIAGQRQPLFGCRIHQEGRRLFWQSSIDEECVATTQDGPVSAADDLALGVQFDAMTESISVGSVLQRFQQSKQLGPYLLVRNAHCDVAAEPDHPVSEIWFVTHHAICDGAGAVSFINDWLQIYGNLQCKLSPLSGLTRINQSQFKSRNSLGLLRWKFLKNLPFQFVGIFGATKFLFRKHAAINSESDLSVCQPEPSNSIEPQAANASCFESVWLGSNDLKRLIDDSRHAQVTLNAFLLGQLMSALERWYQQTDSTAKSRPWIRIILPMSIRDISHRYLPAVNRTSIVQIDRRNLSRAVDVETLQGLDREIGVIRRWQLDRIFLIAIRCLAVSDTLLRKVAQNQKPRGLSVFTNLGRPLRRYEKLLSSGSRAGLLKPVLIDFLGPIREGTPFNFSFARYDNRLRITLHYDSKTISQHIARKLLDEYLDTLQSRSATRSC